MEPNLVDTNGEFLRSKILGKLGVQGGTPNDKIGKEAAGDGY